MERLSDKSEQGLPLGGGPVFLYSLGSAGLNLVSVTLSTWLLYFYAPPVDSGRTTILSPGQVGWILLAASLWNALIDPLIGHWSDNHRSGRGRRRPFIRAGIPLLFFSFCLVWIPPAPRHSVWTAVYLLVILLVHFGAFSLIGVPYDATLAEMARSPSDRLRLSYWKNVLGIFGVAIGVLVTTPLFTGWGGAAMGLVVGAAGSMTLLASLPGIRESPLPPGDPIAIRAGMRITWGNRPFLLFFLTTLTVYISYQMLLAIIPYLTTVVFSRPERDVRTILLIMIGAIILGGPSWLWAGRKVTQKALLQICLGGMTIAQVAFFLFARPAATGFLWRALFLVFPLGFFIGGFLIIAFAFLGTIVDEDFRRSGRRREAVYYGSFTLAMGLGISLGNLLLPLGFSWFGYSRSQPLGVRLGFLVMAFFSLLGFIMFSRLNAAGNTGKSAVKDPDRGIPRSVP